MYMLAALVILGVVVSLTHYAHPLQARSVSTTTPTSSTSVFIIPEFGVKMTLPNGLSPDDLVYDAQLDRPVTAADQHPWSTASFTTKSLLQLDSACTAAEGSIGMIVRYTEDPKAIKAEVRESLPLGNYYFAFAAPQGSCGMSPDAQKLESEQIGLLQQAFNTISLVN